MFEKTGSHLAVLLILLGGAAWLCLLGFLFRFYYKMTRPRTSDYEAIDEFLQSRGLSRITVTSDNNHWRYWIRGRLSLSNIARIYIVEAEEKGGVRREFHVAFDNWFWRGGELQVLLERKR